MSTVNILFYSNNCELSKQLLSMLNNENLTRFFHLICTDNNSKIPPQINLTPTLIIRGVPTPYIAGDAFVWLAKIKQWKMMVMMQKMNSAQQQYLQSINNNLIIDKTNILGFSGTEMNAMSDMFSFFSKNISQECQDSLPQSYFDCSNMGQENIFTPPAEDPKYKITESVQKTMEHKLLLERKQQDKMFKENIDNFRKQYDVK